jgi:hypothetical protein
VYRCRTQAPHRAGSITQPLEAFQVPLGNDAGIILGAERSGAFVERIWPFSVGYWVVLLMSAITLVGSRSFAFVCK